MARLLVLAAACTVTIASAAIYDAVGVANKLGQDLKNGAGFRDVTRIAVETVTEVAIAANSSGVPEAAIAANSSSVPASPMASSALGLGSSISAKAEASPKEAEEVSAKKKEAEEASAKMEAEEASAKKKEAEEAADEAADAEAAGLSAENVEAADAEAADEEAADEEAADAEAADAEAARMAGSAIEVGGNASVMLEVAPERKPHHHKLHQPHRKAIVKAAVSATAAVAKMQVEHAKNHTEKHAPKHKKAKTQAHEQGHIKTSENIPLVAKSLKAERKLEQRLVADLHKLVATEKTNKVAAASESRLERSLNKGPDERVASIADDTHATVALSRRHAKDADRDRQSRSLFSISARSWKTVLAAFLLCVCGPLLVWLALFNPPLKDLEDLDVSKHHDTLGERSKRWLKRWRKLCLPSMLQAPDPPAPHAVEPSAPWWPPAGVALPPPPGSGRSRY